jgi:hypothetical protein
MVVRKYFQFIEIWVPCPICEQLGYAPMVNLRVSKEEINRGLQLGIYTHDHPHGPEGHRPHSVSVYINQKYEVTGSKALDGNAKPVVAFASGTVVPVVTKKVPDMAVALGMVTPDEFSTLKACDGNNSVDEVASILRKSRGDVDTILQKLKDKGLVNLVKKA